MKPPFKGLIAATFTPMSADGSINLRQIEKHAALLVESRVSGAFINGSTGESLSLGVEERKALAQRWCEVARGAFPVIVHVGHTSLVEARTLAAHAQAVGAQAIATIAPCFFRPQTVADLVTFCAEVAAAAPKLPFYYYHLPSLTGVTLSMREFLEQAARRIPTLAGLKYTHYNLTEFRECVTWDGGRFNILFGCDDILLPALVLGCQGGIGSTYNCMGPHYHEIIKAYQSGQMEKARRLQDQAMQLIRIVIKHGPLPSLKAIMKWQGVDCGLVRAPLTPLSTPQLRRLKRELRDLPVFVRPLP